MHRRGGGRPPPITPPYTSIVARARPVLSRHTCRPAQKAMERIDRQQRGRAWSRCRSRSATVLPLSSGFFGRLWQREMEGGAPSRIARGPNGTAMRLDDRLCNRKPHSHARGLGRKERLENPLLVTVVQTHPSVLDGYVDCLVPVGFAADQDGPVSSRDLSGRVHGIDEQ